MTAPNLTLQQMAVGEELRLVDAPNGLTPYQTRFALFYIQGYSPNEAVQEAKGRGGHKLNDRQLTQEARKLLKLHPMRAYLRSLAAQLEKRAVADALEIQMFLTEAMRTPIGAIDEDHRLCQRRKVTRRTDKDGGETETVELESVSKMDAVKTLIRMKGLDAPLQVEHTHAVGVMIVPMSHNVDDWQAAAVDSQRRLMADAIGDVA
tara:strand:+ start:717 stop:1334 length:618 start_codon:yes stop_codon:yes gene_type:complete